MVSLVVTEDWLRLAPVTQLELDPAKAKLIRLAVLLFPEKSVTVFMPVLVLFAAP